MAAIAYSYSKCLLSVTASIAIMVSMTDKVAKPVNFIFIFVKSKANDGFITIVLSVDKQHYVVG